MNRDEMRFFHDSAVEYEPAETDEPTEVSSVLDRIDDAASETDTQDGLIEKVTVAQECNGLSEQDVTILQRKSGVTMRWRRRRSVTSASQFLKHFWKPKSIMIWLAILIEALQLDWMKFFGAVYTASHQQSLQLVRRVEGFGRY